MELNELNLNEDQLKGVEDYIKEVTAKEITKATEGLFTEDAVTKRLQSETDKVRTDYSKKLKDVEDELVKYKPVDKSESEIELDKRLKALEDKEKEVQAKEKLLKVSETLEGNGLDKQLAKYLNVQGVEDLESYVKEVSTVIQQHITDSKIDNSFKPNNHQSKKDTITKEDFNKMGYMERTKLFTTNKDLYDRLNK